MAVVKVNIEKKAYQLKFGYGVFRRLAKYYNIEGFTAFGAYVEGLGFGKNNGDLSFPQLNFIGNLIIAAAEYASVKPIKLDLDYVIDNVVLKTPEKLPEILQAFSDSFPKSGDEGKPNPATRRKKK